MGIKFSLADCENTLLREIAEKAAKRRAIAQTYALAMRSAHENGERIDWAKVNAAIIARWSFHALEWIKKQAHSGKCWGGV